jgi:hypothetical protein
MTKIDSYGSKLGLLFVIILCCSNKLQSQSQLPVNINVNSSSIYNNGTSVTVTNQVPIVIQVSNVYSLTVFASLSGNPANGSYTIPASNIQMKATSQSGFTTGYTATQITLSTSNQQVFSGNLSNPNNSNQTDYLSFTYTLAGGANLLQPGGTYSSTINFTVNAYDNHGNFVASGTGPASMSIFLSNLSTISVASGASTASLNFNSASAYQNGVSLNQSAALTAFCNQAYHVTVAASQNIKNGSNSIPISNVTLDATPSTGGTGITTPATVLSITAQTFITSSSGSLSQNFDLLYYTSAGNTAFLNLPAGTYTTTLTFTITSP